MTRTGKIRPPLTGVDTAALVATLVAVRANPETAKVRFRTTNRWQGGTHSRGTVRGIPDAGGAGHDPTPMEFLLDALTACLTAGIVNIAAASEVTLHSVSSTVEGELDLRGVLGLSADARNGYQAVRVSFQISGDAPADVLRNLVERSGARSAVHDVLSDRVPISVEVGSG
jgi:uncharacterized OsmC-like protein